MEYRLGVAEVLLGDRAKAAELGNRARAAGDRELSGGLEPAVRFQPGGIDPPLDVEQDVVALVDRAVIRSDEESHVDLA